MLLHVVVPLATVLFITVAAQNPPTKPKCSDILPTYELDNGATFDTKALFHFVALLPPYIGYEEYRTLVETARERCGMQPPDPNVRTFRASCYALERSFASHRRPPPRIDFAKSAEEAAAIAALTLAWEGMMREPAGCYSMCPCSVDVDACPMPTDDGQCVEPLTPIADLRSDVPSFEPVETQEAELMIEESYEPEVTLEQPPSTSTAATASSSPSISTSVSASASASVSASVSASPSFSQTVIPSPSISMSPMPSPTSTPNPSSSAAQKVVPLSANDIPVASSSPGDTSTSIQGAGLSKPAVIGIAIGGVLLVSAVGLVAIQQVAFRRRHADEIEQWRHAFRVVED